MLSYSKLAQTGIAAVSYLAEISPENRLAGSAEIAEKRHLSRTLVAKILTKLSAANIVFGKSGPTGGYQLARPPAEITLLDVIKVFENPDNKVMCPFGPNWCGIGPTCPAHDTLFNLHESTLERLQQETYDRFIGHSRDDSSIENT
ncbi:MAG: RrF2 family transcriptional regulator [Chthoniobacterales bacterium]